MGKHQMKILDNFPDNPSSKVDRGGAPPAGTFVDLVPKERKRGTPTIPRGYEGSRKPNSPEAKLLAEVRTEKFISEYLKDFCAERAAKRAGITGNNNYSQLLYRPEIKAEIIRRIREQHTDITITPERVVNEIATIALSNIWDYCEVYTDDEGTERLRILPSFEYANGDPKARYLGAAIKSIKQFKGEVTITLHDKAWAMGIMAKYFGLYEEKNPLEVLMSMLPEGFQQQLKDAIIANTTKQIISRPPALDDEILDTEVFDPNV